MIYVAGPYYHRDSEVIGHRMEQVYSYMAELTKQGEICVSPMLMHSVVIRYDLPNNFAFWGKYSLLLLSKCSKIHVLKLQGWDVSSGVSAEVDFALNHNIAITYIKAET